MTFMEKSALELLLKCGVGQFPVDAAQIARDLNYNLVDYQKGASLIATAGLESMYMYAGFSAKIGEKYYIFFEEKLNREKKNWIIAHEIAHIRHHFVSEGLIGHSTNGEENQILEREAEDFAKSLLAPLYALTDMKIVDPTDIERITGLDPDKAREVFFDLSEYEMRQEELLLQSRVCKQFHTNRNRLIRLRIAALLLLCVLVIAGCAFFLLRGRFSTPTLADPDEPTSPAESLSPTDAQTNAFATAPFDGTYFWTGGGEVYHLYRDCQALKSVTDPVSSGNLEEAQAAKTRICRFCERRLQREEETAQRAESAAS